MDPGAKAGHPAPLCCVPLPQLGWTLEDPEPALLTCSRQDVWPGPPRAAPPAGPSELRVGVRHPSSMGLGEKTGLWAGQKSRLLLEVLQLVEPGLTMPSQPSLVWVSVLFT